VALPSDLAGKAHGAGPDVVLGLRPEALRLSPDGEIDATVIIVELLGAETHVICHTEDGTRLIVRQAAAATKPGLGEEVRIAVDGDARSYHLFESGSDGQRMANT
jgi:ABC-type sugar transport system ATPase subunit